MRIFLSTMLLIAAAFGAAPALAQQKFENLDRIDSLVAMTVGANLGEPGGPAAPVDRRLKLAACPQTPSIDGPVFGAAIVKCDAIGWRIRVALVPGGANVSTPVAQQRMAAPAFRQGSKEAPREAIVKRGDPVQLIAGGRAFSITRLMIADEDGAMGEMIRVRDDKKSNPVMAQVVDSGMVRIPGFKEN